MGHVETANPHRIRGCCETCVLPANSCPDYPFRSGASAITAARISSGGPDALLQYLAALISKHGGRDRIRVQHVLELYDCGLVREARRGAQALARAGCTSHGAAEDWDAKRAALLVDPQAVVRTQLLAALVV